MTRLGLLASLLMGLLRMASLVLVALAIGEAEAQSQNIIFSDDFHRLDSNVTGNGWIDTRVGYGPIGAGISSNRQYMISNNNGQPITYRTDITQTSGIVIKGKFSSSNLTDGYLKIGLLAAEGYHDSGYAAVFAAQLPSQSVFLVDNNRGLMSVPFTFNNTDVYAYEWAITPSPQNWSYLYVWNASHATKPSTPTLVWNNNGNNYNPTVSGNRFYFTSGLQGLVQPTETMYTYLVEIDRYVQPFMGFPLKCTDHQCGGQHYTSGAYTPGTITTVLDHSMKKNPGTPFWQYGTLLTNGGDGVVMAYTGEGIGKPGVGPYEKGDARCITGAFSIEPIKALVNTRGCGPGFVSYDEHPGYDYVAAMRTPVFAVAGGTVVRAIHNRKVGYEYCYNTFDSTFKTFCSDWGLVGIDHGNGYISQYGHLDTIFVAPGQRDIKEGTLIGLSGNKGLQHLKECLQGPNHCAHLHFEVLKKTGDVNSVCDLQSSPPTCLFVDPYGWSGAKLDPLYCPDPSDTAHCIANRPASVTLWK